MAFHVVADPLQKQRLVSLKISAPRYQEGSDSKIPLHLTGRTVSGRVISLHVYVSPKAAAVRLEPGQYTVTVEASPLLSSGDVYRIPQPLKIDTASGSNFVGESKPIKQDLKFEVKPASEVTASDLQAVAKFAKKSAAPVKKLDFLNEKIRRQKVSTAFSQVLDMLSTKGIKGGSSDGKSSRYSLFDLDEDGVPELFTWNGINGDKKRASDGPVGCGDKQDDFSGNRVWKYDVKKNIAFCFSEQSLPNPDGTDYYFGGIDRQMLAYESDSSVPSEYNENDDYDYGGINYTTLTVDQGELKTSSQTFRDLFHDGWCGLPNWPGREANPLITSKDILSLYGMSLPKSVSAQGVVNYEKYARQVSDWTANGVQTLIGTVKLMTDKEIIDYQHQYVTQHHLDKEQDPTLVNDPWLYQNSSQSDIDEADEQDYPWVGKNAVLLSDGDRVDQVKMGSRTYEVPLYLWHMDGLGEPHGLVDAPEQEIIENHMINEKYIFPVVSEGVWEDHLWRQGGFTWTTWPFKYLHVTAS